MEQELKIRVEESKNAATSPLIVIEISRDDGDKDAIQLNKENWIHLKTLIDGIDEQLKIPKKPIYQRQNGNKSSIELEMEETIRQLRETVAETERELLMGEIDHEMECITQLGVGISNTVNTVDEFDGLINSFNESSTDESFDLVHPWEYRLERQSWLDEVNSHFEDVDCNSFTTISDLSNIQLIPPFDIIDNKFLEMLE